MARAIGFAVWIACVPVLDAGAQQRPGCDDPTRQPGRFKVDALEATDTRSGLVWFRCPAMWVSDAGTCDPSQVLPSETWDSAVEVPTWAVKRRSAWRLASVEELDTIAAKGCNYLVNPEIIEVMFDTVWTRSTATEGKVWRYGVDRARVQSLKKADRTSELFAQTIYVRNAP
jgi:hypothetical protein